LRIEHEAGSIAADKRADFCVLEDDPFELGVDRLHELRIVGTVFEGVPHLLPQPAASSLGSAFAHGRVADTPTDRPPTTERAAAEQAPASGDLTAPSSVTDPTNGRYRPLTALRNACCGFADRCDIVRQWSAWLGAARAGAAG